MVTILNEHILWWHWVAFGLLLLLVEIGTGTFILLGLGVAAITVGIIDAFYPMGFTYTLLIWTALSVGYLLAWKKWMEKQSVSDTGQSNYSLKTLGTVIDPIQPHKKGKVHFDIPVLGQSVWIAIAEQPIAKGEQVEIVEIIGQLIKVKKV